ncbi:MAG: metal-dependent transcriptional regulator [Candidatus Hadarchaeota archaeon]
MHRQQIKQDKEFQASKEENVKSSKLEFSGEKEEELHLTSGEEDYLRSIQELSTDEEVTVSGVAAHMGHKAPSVTEMVARLSEKGLVDHEKYGRLSLTERGRKIAKRVKTKHNTLSKFLKLFGVDKKRAETDACRMEHPIHEKTLKRLEKFVEFVEKSPNEPVWLNHFKDYIDTGEHSECRYRS